MNLQQLSSKIVNRLSSHAYKLFGVDSISLAKIMERSDLQEIGTEYGGWVVPTQLLGPDSVCYCVGCGEDISFDLGLIGQFGCDVYAFDPTPRAGRYVAKAAAGNSKYHFYDFGLWEKEDTLKFYAPKIAEHVSHSLVNLQKTEDYILVKVKRLSQIMQELGHTRIDLLKIDIEGAEYKVLETVLEDKLHVKIICVEYDECFNALDYQYKERIRTSVGRLLDAGYALVCAQGKGNYTFVKQA